MRRRFWYLAAGMLPLLIGCDAERLVAPEAATAASGWQLLADYPADRFRMGVATVTDASGRPTIYAIGGQTLQPSGYTPPTNAVKAYDVQRGVWRARAPFPVANVWDLSVGVVKGRIYAIGGMTKLSSGRREFLRRTYVYDPATDAWTRRADPPTYLAGGVLGVYQDRIYVYGSCGYPQVPNCGLSMQGMFRYNPATDRWAFLGQGPRTHHDGAGGFIGGRFYLVAGMVYDGARYVEYGPMSVYDPATGTWSDGPGLPHRLLSAPAYTTLGARLHVTGGSIDPGEQRATYVYSPATNRWVTAPPHPQPVWTVHLGGTKAWINGAARFVVIGGVRPGNSAWLTP